MLTLHVVSETDALGRLIVPKAQERPRFGRGFVRSPKTGWYHLVKWRAMQEAPEKPLDGPLGLMVTFVFPRLKTGPKAQVYKWTKPDCDNLVKAVKDALTQAAWWVDDGRVADSRQVKRYAAPGEPAGAVIQVWPLEDPSYKPKPNKENPAS